METYEVRPRKDHEGVGEQNVASNASNYIPLRGPSHHPVIHVYDATGNVIETHEHSGEFKGMVKFSLVSHCTFPLKC
jgi:hypothetical protein